MLFCFDRDIMEIISAEICFGMSKRGLVCCKCQEPVVLMLDSGFAGPVPPRPRFFKHTVGNGKCEQPRHEAPHQCLAA